MKGRLSPGSKKSWGAESQESQLDLQASWHQGKVVGVPRTALLGHLPATLCPASSRWYNHHHRPPHLFLPQHQHCPHLRLEARAPIGKLFLTGHFIFMATKRDTLPNFFLGHTETSLTVWQATAPPIPSGNENVELIPETHSYDDPRLYHLWTQLHSKWYQLSF